MLLYTITKFLVGVSQNGLVDRVSFWTFVTAIISLLVAFIAWWQLQKMTSTAKIDFLHRFTENFFYQNSHSRNLLMLFDYQLLTFKTNQIKGKDFAYFALDVEAFESLQIYEKDKSNFKNIYLDYDINDELLGYFEDIGNYEKKGLLEIALIEKGFGYYIKTVWENSEIKTYIQWLRDQDQNAGYRGFEYIYQKIICYQKTLKY